MLTRQKVHAVLRKAGLKKTRLTATRIPGWHDRQPGYDVREDDKTIRVAFKDGDHFSPRELRQARAAKEAERYFAALAAFAPRIEADDWHGPEVVLDKDSGGSPDNSPAK